jgi:hypothetical protein
MSVDTTSNVAEQSLSVEDKRRQADMDALLDLVIEHARRVCADVWPGGTVDPDDIHWFWNTRYTSCAGRCYFRNNPDYGGQNVAIGLAPDYYYQFGLEGLLEVARHELIHAWQDLHPDGFDRGGHGTDFKQWVDDLDTHRYCEHWDKQTYAADLADETPI